MEHLASLHILFCVAIIFATCHAQPLEPIANERLPADNIGKSGIDASYDYVIVGGGTAGITLATRLAHNPNISVAIVEAGGFYQIDNGNASVVPAYAYKSANASVQSIQQTNPLVDWMYTTTPQAQLRNQPFHFVRGKCLGGSSGRNYMTYNRATKGAMSKWAREVEDDSYNWDQILPYYQVSTKYTPPNMALRPSNATNSNETDAFHASGGPLHVSYPHYFDPSASYFPAALEEMGLRELDMGCNNGELIGYAAALQTLHPDNATRDSSQTSFLNMAMAKTSLKVYTRTTTENITFDGTTATGTYVSSAGSTFKLTARKEVILSAGVVGSPQLLQISGIGPQALLQKHGIAVVADRPGVGQNLQDNPVMMLGYDTIMPAINEELATTEYLLNATGPLSDGMTDVISFDKISNKDFAQIADDLRIALDTEFGADWPEIETMAGAPGLILGALITTFSRGTVTITSPSVHDSPEIDPQWLSDGRDQQLAIGLIKYMHRLQTTASLKKIMVNGGANLTGSETLSDKDILQFIQATAYSIYHGSCTCKMGARSDPNAVVDSQARVIGARNLRVVDVSAFPFLPPGQPQSMVYALAEKIADRILHDLRYPAGY